MDIILGIIAIALVWKIVGFCIRMNRLSNYQTSYVVQHDRLTASGQHKQARALSDEFDLKAWAAYGVRPTSETVLAIARIKQEAQAERQFTSWDWENTCK